MFRHAPSLFGMLEELTTRIKFGDKQAFELVFKAYYPRLCQFAMRFLNDYDLAEDVVQESFANLWDKRADISGRSVQALLFAMVRNGCLNQLKHAAYLRRQTIDELVALTDTEQLYNLDMVEDAEVGLMYKELQQQINEAVAKLPPRCRQVFVESRFKGLHNHEIAEMLNITDKAVEKQITKALAFLSKELKMA